MGILFGIRSLAVLWGRSGERIRLAHGFSGQVTFMVAPLSPCDLSEFDLGVCCSFWLGCGHIGGKVRSQQGVSQFCTLVSREGIQTGQS